MRAAGSATDDDGRRPRLPAQFAGLMLDHAASVVPG